MRFRRHANAAVAPETAAALRYRRFVALGDSTTEGLEDPYPDGSGYRGWADRLAEIIAEQNPDLLYANLAVRGKKASQVLEEQLPAALALEPDLAAVAVGLNDILRRHCLIGEVIGQIDEIFRALTEAGAQVMTFTYPDPSAANPLARPALARVIEFNRRLRETADEHGAVLLDMEKETVMDRRLWHPDRLHGNSDGHARIAAGMAYELGVIDGPQWWREPLPEASPTKRLVRGLEHAEWTARHFTPWLIRRLRGRSSGDGRSAKRPEMIPVLPARPVAAEPVQEEGRRSPGGLP